MSKLTDFMTGIADGIRERTGAEGRIKAMEFADKIRAIPSEGQYIWKKYELVEGTKGEFITNVVDEKSEKYPEDGIFENFYYEKAEIPEIGVFYEDYIGAFPTTVRYRCGEIPVSMFDRGRNGDTSFRENEPIESKIERVVIEADTIREYAFRAKFLMKKYKAKIKASVIKTKAFAFSFSGNSSYNEKEISKVWLAKKCVTVENRIFDNENLIDGTHYLFGNIETITLYCEHEAKPETFHNSFNYGYGHVVSASCTVIWGVSEAEFDAL